jgi:ABC-2 type transport system ATP-binding protein
MGDSEVVIDVEGLTKSFGDRVVVRDLSMQVRKGLIYGFLGPNGSGKTTTIRMLCGLLTPDSGQGTCLGYDIRSQAAAIKRHVGYMTQKFSLYADLSIRENLEFVARVYNLPIRARRHRTPLRGWAGEPRRSVGGRSLGRLEAAPGARRMHPARARGCSFSTSRPPGSTPRRGATSGTRSTPSPTRA